MDVVFHILKKSAGALALLPGDGRRQDFGRLDAQLFIDILAAEYDLDIADPNTELAGQKQHHVIGCIAGSGLGGDAHI